MPFEDIPADEIVKEPFSERVIRNQAIGNALWITMVTGEFLETEGISPQKWALFAGERFAASWDEVKGRPAKDIMTIAVVNLACLGAEPADVIGDDRRAEARVTWPPVLEDQTPMDRFSSHVVDCVWDVFRPICSRLDLDYQWHRDGDQVVMTMSRAA